MINTHGWDGIVDATSDRFYSFYWPVAPGDWWSPNFGPGGFLPSYRPHGYSPGDTVQFIISPQVRLLKKGSKTELAGPPYLFQISVWGGDDTYMEMAPQVYMTAEEVQVFLTRIPNPVSKEWLKSRGFGMYLDLLPEESESPLPYRTSLTFEKETVTSKGIPVRVYPKDCPAICPFCDKVAYYSHYDGECSPYKPFTVGFLWWRKTCRIGGYHRHYSCRFCGTHWITPRVSEDSPVAGYLLGFILTGHQLGSTLLCMGVCYNG